MTDTQDIKVGDKVTVVRKVQDGEETLNGKVEVSNEMGLVIKPTGKVNVVLIEKAAVVSVSVDALPVKVIKVKKLMPLQPTDARSHLTTHHGYTLAQVNADGFSDADAFTVHQGLDHAGLGHNHENQSKGAAPDTTTPDAG